jgi:PAS domain S-box-containing protein
MVTPLSSIAQTCAEDEVGFHKLLAMLRTMERMAGIGAVELDIIHDSVVWPDELDRIMGRDSPGWAPTVSNFIAHIHPDDRERVQEAIYAAMTDHEPLREQFRIVRQDGSKRIVRAWLEPTLDRTDKVVTLVGTIHDITEAALIETKRHEDETRFRSLVEQNVAGVAIIRNDATVAYANPYLCGLMGLAPAEVIGRATLDFISEAEKPTVADNLQMLISGKTHFVQLETELCARPAGVVNILVNASSSIHDGEQVTIAVVIDITEHKEAERSLARLNRALRTLSRGNVTVVRATSESELLQQMCSVVVQSGGYRLAWIGNVEQDAAKTVRPVAWAGEEAHSLVPRLDVSWAETASGLGPAGRAIRTGETQISHDIAADTSMARWAWLAKDHEIGSSAVFPLKNGSSVFAIMLIYAAEQNVFDVNELKLLQELADDLSYGVTALRQRDKHAVLEHRWSASLATTVGAIARTLEMRDPYTAGHQQRVSRLAVAIARLLEISEERIQGLFLASIIHDVGKGNVPSDILNKPGKLSKLEFALIQEHAEAGYNIISGIDFPWPVAEMVRQHHERLDGSGYPRGLKGDEMLEEAKILAVADVVESMMSHRPYRAALGIEAALAEIENNKGRLFDPKVVDACVTLFRDKDFSFDAVPPFSECVRP